MAHGGDASVNWGNPPHVGNNRAPAARASIIEYHTYSRMRLLPITGAIPGNVLQITADYSTISHLMIS